MMHNMQAVLVYATRGLLSEGIKTTMDGSLAAFIPEHDGYV